MENITKKFCSLKKDKKLLIILFILLIGCIILNAWLCDDAYISFRVVKNFVNGKGLIWNPNERVQVFTNPLMVLLLSTLYFFTHEIFYTSILFCTVCTTIGLYILLFKISKNTKFSILLVILLVLSKSFIAYSTSGLENSLTFMLLSIFYLNFFSKKEFNKKKLLILSFTSALILLNRMDSILLVLAPLFISFFIKKEKSINFLNSIKYGIIGVIPFILWECFSFIYYGFLIPNTAFAKLSSGIPNSEYLINGIRYMIGVYKLDPFTIFSILFLFIFVLIKNKNKLLLIGPFISILYIINVGGDFMLGRFLTPALFTLCIIASQSGKTNFLNKFFNQKLIPYILIIFILFISIWQYFYNTTYTAKLVYGVEDEQAGYFYRTSLINIGSEKTIKTKKASFYKGSSINNQDVYLWDAIGFVGYFCDNCIIIDFFGLSDAFISKIPVDDKTIKRIGHIYRPISEDYINSILNDNNEIKNIYLKEYYDKIKIITQGKIFSKKRFKTIINMNLGKYEYLKEQYKKEVKYYILYQ